MKHDRDLTGGFCAQNEEPLFSKDGRTFFFVRAIPQGGQGKFYHITVSSSQVRPAAGSTVWVSRPPAGVLGISKVPKINPLPKPQRGSPGGA